jgi:hypothetical protein
MALSLPPSQADPASWACVTAYKAASSYVGTLLARLFQGRGVSQVDLGGYAYAHGMVEATFCIENQGLLRTPGYYFGPFRDSYIADMPALRDTKLIIHVRDPRDCIVSHYYSVAYSHHVPPSGPVHDDLTLPTGRRQIYLREGIDWAALGEDCVDFHKTFSALRDFEQAIGSERAYVSRYEDMVTDFPGWLDRLCAFTRCDHLTPLVEAIKHETTFAVRENKLNHMRQVTPGDFRRKLKPETQRTLTARLSDVIGHFGYPET